MSSLWTPGGERPVPREPAAGQGSPGGPSHAGAAGRAGGDPGAEPTEEEIRAQMAELQEELARTPASVVIVNHVLGLFNLARLHLSLLPPQLDQARLAIDAMAALVDGLGDRLGEDAAPLSEGLAQLRIAYVQIHSAQQSGVGGAPGPGSDGVTGGVTDGVTDGGAEAGETASDAGAG